MSDPYVESNRREFMSAIVMVAIGFTILVFAALPNESARESAARAQCEAKGKTYLQLYDGAQKMFYCANLDVTVHSMERR